MNNEEYNKLIDEVIIPALFSTRQSGGKEYARSEENIFANFERISESLDISVEECIMVYLMKHIDGIVAHVKGHVSQREDVRGRMLDVIVYLTLLWGYLVKDENNEESPINSTEGKVNIDKDGDYSLEQTHKVYPKKGMEDGVIHRATDKEKILTPLGPNGKRKGCCGGQKKPPKDKK